MRPSFVCLSHFSYEVENTHDHDCLIFIVTDIIINIVILIVILIPIAT